MKNLVMTLALPVVTLALLTSSASSQVTLVGPLSSGAPYSQIDPAIAATPVGGTVLVKAGTYDPFTLTKEVSVIGEGSSVVTVEARGLDQESFSVLNLPLGTQVAVSGFSARGGPTSEIGSYVHAVGLVSGCAGTVALHDLRIGDTFDPTSVGTPDSLIVQNCSDVRVLESKAWGHDYAGTRASRGFNCQTSTVHIAGSNFIGGSGNFGTGLSSGELTGKPGLLCVDSKVSVWQTGFKGGDGGLVAAPYQGQSWYEAGPGIRISNSDVELLGWLTLQPFTFGKVIRAGQSGCKIPECFNGAMGIEVGSWGTLTTGSEVVIAGGKPPCTGLAGAICTQDNGFGPPVKLLGVAFSYPGIANGPSLKVGTPQTSPGATLTLRASGKAGRTVQVYWAPKQAPGLTFPGISGELLLDPQSASFLGSLAINAPHYGSLSVVVPAMPSLVGVTAFLQGLQIGGPMTFTNLCAVTII